MDATCLAIVSAMATALVSVTGWGVKQAKDKEKILREWLDASREQIRMLNVVDQANKKEDDGG